MSNFDELYSRLDDKGQRTLEGLLLDAIQAMLDECRDAIEAGDDNDDDFRGCISADRGDALRILGALLGDGGTHEDAAFDVNTIEWVLRLRRARRDDGTISMEILHAPLELPERFRMPVPDSPQPSSKLIDLARHRASRNRQRRRGPIPERRTAVAAAMQTAISTGRFSLDQLWDMPQEALAAEFDCSRKTAVKALVNLSEETGTELEQEPEQNRDKEQLGTPDT